MAPKKPKGHSVSKIPQALGAAVGGLLVSAFGPAAGEVGQIAEAEAAYWKLRHASWLRDRIERDRQLRKLPPVDKAVPTMIAYKIIEEAAYVTDETLRDRWTRLLVNATTTTQRVDIERRHIDVLSGMSPLDARILDLIAKAQENPILGVYTDRLPNEAVPWREKEKYDADSGPSDEVNISLVNLIRLGCLFPIAGFGGPIGTGVVRMTALGRDLVRSCSEDPRSTAP